VKFVRKLSKTLQIEAKTGDVLYDLNRKLGTHYLDLNGLPSFWTESLWALGYRYKSLLNNVNNSNTTKNNTWQITQMLSQISPKIKPNRRRLPPTRTKKKLSPSTTYTNKKLSYRWGTARCVVSVEILPVATQQYSNYLYDKSWTKYQLSLIDPCDKIVL